MIELLYFLELPWNLPLKPECISTNLNKHLEQTIDHISGPILCCRHNTDEKSLLRCQLIFLVLKKNQLIMIAFQKQIQVTKQQPLNIANIAPV